MNAVRLIRAAVFIFTSLIIVGSGQASPRGELAVYAGAVVSNNPAFDSLVMVEFPFSLNRDEFTFFVQDSAEPHLYARVFSQVDLLDSSGHAIDSVRTYFSLRVNDSEEAAIEGYRVFNKLIMMVRPGRYAARLTVIDVASKAQGEFFFPHLLIEPTDKQILQVGGACLAYDLKYVGEDSPVYNPRLYKNGFHVTVNPVSVFERKDTLVYVYGEIYNMKYSPEAPSEYRLGLRVLDAQDNETENLGSRVAEKPGASAVITESFNISGWRTGNYRLEVVADDLETSMSDTVYLPFGIVSTEAILAAATIQRQAARWEDSLTIADHVKIVTYILPPEQMRILEGLSDEGKKNYLNQFWRERDENPASDVLETRQEMIRRYMFCNQFFSTNQARTNGWATDRGRIYMTYGSWDERDEYPAPRIGNAFEVWNYRAVKEGKFFLFEDWTGNDDYRLVHSNVFGEPYSKEWQDQIDEGYIDLTQ